MTNHITVTDKFVSFILENEIDPLDEKMVGRINLNKTKSTKRMSPETTGTSSTSKVKGPDSRQVMKRTKSKEVNRTAKALVTPAQKASNKKRADGMASAQAKAAERKAAMKEENSPLRQKAIDLLGKKKGNSKADRYKKIAANLRKKGEGLGSNDAGTAAGKADAARDTHRKDAPGDK
jgi:hypothetical protein